MDRQNDQTGQMGQNAPDVVRIGFLDYTVQRVAGLFAADADGRYARYHGRVHFGEQLIEIERDASPERQWATLWHEITHVLLEQAGIEEQAGQEQIVTVLGYGIPAVLQANPWLGAPSR